MRGGGRTALNKPASATVVMQIQASARRSCPLCCPCLLQMSPLLRTHAPLLPPTGLRLHPAFSLDQRGVWHAVSLSLCQQLVGPVRACADLRLRGGHKGFLCCT